MMNKQKFNYSKLTAICAVVATILIQVVSTSVATTAASPSVAFTEADLSSESRTLDSFVTDLAKFDSKGVELAKKASLTRAEFATQEQSANDLKRRVSGIQNALRDAIRKLKAAGQWDSLDQTVLAKISDPNFQSFVRNEGFKKTLEETASGLSNDANQISSPLDGLRNKVQGAVFEPGTPSLASLAVRVAYTPPPAMLAFNLRCRLASVRLGFTGLFHGQGHSTNEAIRNFNCQCHGTDCPGAS
jgi:hypothetical protein